MPLLRCLSSFLICITFLSSSPLVNATVVVHSLQEQVQGWYTTLQANYATSSSTVEKTDYKGDFRVSNNSDEQQWLLFGNLAYSDVDGTRSDDSQLLHGRYIYKGLIGKLNAEAFVQREQDDFALLASRQLYGAGLSLLKKHDNFALHSMIGVMEESETHISDVTQDRRLTRVTLSSQLQYQLQNKARITLVAYFQPALSQWSDYRSTAKANFAFPLTNHLDITMGYSWRYNGDAFTGVPPIKRSFSTGISYHF